MALALTPLKLDGELANSPDRRWHPSAPARFARVRMSFVSQASWLTNATIAALSSAAPARYCAQRRLAPLWQREDRI